MAIGAPLQTDFSPFRSHSGVAMGTQWFLGQGPSLGSLQGLQHAPYWEKRSSSSHWHL